MPWHLIGRIVATVIAVPLSLVACESIGNIGWIRPPGGWQTWPTVAAAVAEIWLIWVI